MHNIHFQLTKVMLDILVKQIGHRLFSYSSDRVYEGCNKQTVVGSIGLYFDNCNIEIRCHEPKNRDDFSDFANEFTCLSAKLWGAKEIPSPYGEGYDYAKQQAIPPELPKYEIDAELQKIVCDEIDKIFETSVSAKAFKYVPPLAIVPLDNEGKDFDFYVLLFLKALSVEIQKYSEKMNKATEKHIGKYRK